MKELFVVIYSQSRIWGRLIPLIKRVPQFSPQSFLNIDLNYVSVAEVHCLSMPPQRTRLIIDDARSEASSTRDRTGGNQTISANCKSKRNGNNILANSAPKDFTSTAPAASQCQETQDDQPKVDSIPPFVTCFPNPELLD